MKDNIFRKEPPITGGSFFADKQLIQAKESLFKSNFVSQRIEDNIKKNLNTENFTYNIYFLIHQQADYFTSMVKFRFSDKNLTENLYKAIRCGVIYGRSALWWTSQGLIPLYIGDIQYDSFTGKPQYMKAALVDNIFSQKQLEPQINNWVKFNAGEFENIYIFNSSSMGMGGLIRWNPFLKQLENLLKMLYTHSYSYLKFVLYDVKDPNFIEKEMKLFFNIESPFLVNLGDESLIRNKFKEFNFSNAAKNEIFEYINNFLDLYYGLIGRRYNVDVKRERNIKGEVEASQESFDAMMNELRQYIILMLEWVEFKTGAECIYEPSK